MMSKYVTSDCLQIVGAVDCNEKLEYQEQNNRFFSSGTGSPFTGECVTCHPNGILEHHIRFVDGREEGVDTTYYYSGCPMVIRENIQGLENGTWRFYYDSTQQLAWQKQYSRGMLVGTNLNFDNKGDTTVIEHYKNNVLDGVKKVFYTQNKVKRIINYKNGLFNGTYQLFNLEGKLIQSENYKMGKKDGVCTFYYDDGKLLRTEVWTSDVKNGAFNTYFYDGQIMKSENYKKGIKEGTFDEYYSNHQLKSQKIYLKGNLLEEHRFNEYGDETYTSEGAKPYSAHEDDELPGAKKGKKKKKK